MRNSRTQNRFGEPFDSSSPPVETTPRTPETTGCTATGGLWDRAQVTVRCPGVGRMKTLIYVSYLAIETCGSVTVHAQGHVSSDHCFILFLLCDCSIVSSSWQRIGGVRERRGMNTSC